MGRTAGLLAACWSPHTAFAQPPAAPPAQPPTRDQIRGSLDQPARDARQRLNVEGGLERAPCALDRPEYQSIRFTPTGAEFENLKGLTPDRLRAAYAPFLGKDQPLSVVCEIRDRAAAILRDAGYIATVEVPEQRIEGGQLRFRVLMARLVGLRVRGNAGANERLIARYLERLAGQEVFNTRDAERYLLLAGDIPGYNVRLALRPAGTVPGEVVGEVTVVGTPAQLDLNFQNYGSRAVGREGALLRGQLFGLTGLGDRTLVALYSTIDFEEQQTLQLAHDFRLGAEGLRIGGQVTHSWARPDIGQAGIDLESRTMFATVDAAYPFIRSQRLSLWGGGGLDVIDQDVEFNGLPLSRDRLRVLFGRVDFEAVALVGAAQRAARLGPAWRLEGGLELRQGLSALGASEGCGPNFVNCTAPAAVPPARFEGDPDATVLRWRLAGEARPAPAITVFLGFTGQYTGSPLFSFEEFSAGNYTVGRGYDPATLVGDRGSGVQAEVRFGTLRPNSPTDLAVQPYLFFDAARIYNQERIFVVDERERLMSMGAGIRAIYGDRAQLDLLLAVPLVRAGLQTETPDPRFLLSFTTRLWPWSSR